jgi:pSer/pThr/pTyr-binding forkhead associated (FHA) protein
MARMILSLNGQTLAEYNLSKERYTVGRLPDNDIRIDNPAVSGHHSLVINILNDSFLEDLNSTNGTYVNGKLIKKHALAHGDVVTIGHHQLRFVDEASTEPGGVRKDHGDRARRATSSACAPPTGAVPEEPPATHARQTGAAAGADRRLRRT